MSAKTPSTLCVAFQNIQGLPLNLYSEKHTQIINIINKLHIDLLGIAEINLNLSCLPSSQQWKERFKHLLHKHTICSTNTNTTAIKKIVYGGTAQLAVNTLAHRALLSGTDPSGFGRWSWTRFIGRHGIHLRIITGYRPVSNSNSDGPLQVANQHESHLLSQNNDRAARTAFLEDLIPKFHPGSNLEIFLFSI